MQKQQIESVDERLVNITRFILALSALIIIYVDPSEPDRLVNITYTALALYTLYSAIVYLVSRRHDSPLQTIPLYWIDVAWYVVLISLSSGTNSLFFFFFFFVILVASFRSGYNAGLRVTIVSAILFVTVGYFTTPPPLEPNRFLLRAVYMASIGYLMAYWGGSETLHKRRLALLKDVSRLSNPRFGVDQTVGSIITRIRDFYDADTCFLINTPTLGNAHILRRADRNDGPANRVHSVGAEAEQLLSLPTEWAVTWDRPSLKPWRVKTGQSIYDFRSGEQVNDINESYAWLADLFDTDSFITIPVYRRSNFVGRLYLTSKGTRFNYSDIEFLRQVIDQVMPMIDNIELVDRLASQASEYERQRISRDIHDTAIQPYIGLKLGLDALRRRVSDDDPIASGIAELADKTRGVIDDLRTYVGGLRGAQSKAYTNVLTSSVERHAKQLGEFYGIEVEVNFAGDINVNDRLAAEVFQIVREGLSNIKRHTESHAARIRMTSVNGDMVLDIENETPNGASQAFTPRSITERAVALGGRVSVDLEHPERTVVCVTIPM